MYRIQTHTLPTETVGRRSSSKLDTEPEAVIPNGKLAGTTRFLQKETRGTDRITIGPATAVTCGPQLGSESTTTSASSTQDTTFPVKFFAYWLSLDKKTCHAKSTYQGSTASNCRPNGVNASKFSCRLSVGLLWSSLPSGLIHWSVGCRPCFQFSNWSVAYFRLMGKSGKKEQ
jgi:hypothetical protein